MFQLFHGLCNQMKRTVLLLDHFSTSASAVKRRASRVAEPGIVRFTGEEFFTGMVGPSFLPPPVRTLIDKAYNRLLKGSLEAGPNHGFRRCTFGRVVHLESIQRCAKQNLVSRSIHPPRSEMHLHRRTAMSHGNRLRMSLHRLSMSLLDRRLLFRRTPC